MAKLKWAIDMNKELSKEAIRMAKINIKKCSTSLAIGKIKMKSTLRFHLTLFRTAKIKETTANTCW